MNPNTSLSHLEYLDGWRGLAILTVLVAHFINVPFIREARMGVDIFFVLSGLLMSRILFLKRVPLGRFYKRRVSRVIPVFVVFVCATFFLGSEASVNFSHQEFLSTLVFLRTYMPSDVSIWNSNFSIGHLWSLNVEEHAYLLMSLMTLPLVFRRYDWLAFGIAAVLAQVIFVAYFYSGDNATADYANRTECAISFIFASASCTLFLARYKLMLYRHTSVITFILAIACYTQLAPWWSQYIISPWLLALSVNGLANAPDAIKKFLSGRVITSLGVLSYSIYIWQQPFYDNQDMMGPYLALTCAVFVGVVSFYFLERPIRNWLNENW